MKIPTLLPFFISPSESCPKGYKQISFTDRTGVSRIQCVPAFTQSEIESIFRKAGGEKPISPWLIAAGVGALILFVRSR
jgi:hypothetical protein